MTFLAMLGKVLTLAVFVTEALGGFQMNYPESAGYNAFTEPNAPCGGADANVLKSNMTFWDVSGGPIFLTSEYQVTDYLFRATLDANLTNGWVNLLPVLQQNGIGDFCEPIVPVPAGFNGQTGILQVVANTTDGLFYQCAVLMFQNTAVSTPQGICKNGSSVYSEYITYDSALNMIAGSSVEGGSAMSSMSSMSMSMSMTSTSSMAMMSTTMPSSTMTSMPASSPTTIPNKSKHSLGGGAIAGIVIGSLAGVFIIILLALFFIQRSRRNTSDHHEKTSNIDTPPRKYAAELSGEGSQSPTSPHIDSAVDAYPVPWTGTAYHQPQVVKPNDNGTVDSRSTTAASGRISGYSDLSAAAGPSASAISAASREQLRAEYERVRKQRQRLEEVTALSEREEELERELMKSDL
ncbi:hypothetical protein V8E51_002690 [Hyaloscypha variabilis]